MHLRVVCWIAVFVTLAAAVTQAINVVLIVRAKRQSKHPIFTSYSAFCCLTALIGLVGYFYVSVQQYFYLYWVASFLFLGLEFLVMYEVFSNVLRPYTAIVDLGRMVFTWATIFLLVAATITALATSGPQASKLTAGVAVGERTMRLMECGLLLLFFFFEKRLNISWRNPNIAIAVGLGVTAAVDLSVSYLKRNFSGLRDEFNLVYIAIYFCVVVFWSYTFRLRQRETSTVLDSPNRLIFQRWNEALAGYGYGSSHAPAAVESFLPGIEKTVDRVLARKVV